MSKIDVIAAACCYFDVRDAQCFLRLDCLSIRTQGCLWSISRIDF